VKRDVTALTDRAYDVVIVGGGIFGVCAAWEATRRGLAVALIDKDDFAHATSAHCFKIVHGGIRYLQHGDLGRARVSSQERNAFLRMAPHLVHPLPIVIPTYGRGKQGKAVLRAGLALYDMLTWDRNRGIPDPERRIPRGFSMSRDEVLGLFPRLDRQGLTGAGVLHDGHIYSPPRLALAFLRSAVDAGAAAANYVEATGLLWAHNRVRGVVAKDTLSGDTFPIQADLVLNAAGPWSEYWLAQHLGRPAPQTCTFSRDAYMIIPRRAEQSYALAVLGQTKDPDALLSRSHRHLFVVPWRDCTLIGVWHRVHDGSPESWDVSEEELREWIDEINGAYPALQLTRGDLGTWNAGLVLFGDNTPGAADLSYGKRSRVVDHQQEHGIDGLITLIGVRYTTARYEAARVMTLILQKLRKNSREAFPAEAPVHGGDIESFSRLLSFVVAQRPYGLGEEVLRPLLHSYGSAYADVLRLGEERAALAATVGDSSVLGAAVVYAAREEMAQTLADVVFRRTDLGTGRYPGADALTECANLMAAELGWTLRRTRAELDAVRRIFTRYGSREAAAPGQYSDDGSARVAAS